MSTKVLWRTLKVLWRKVPSFQFLTRNEVDRFWDGLNCCSNLRMSFYWFYHYSDVFQTAEEPARELPLRHGKGQRRSDVLQAPGGVVDHVPHDGEARQLWHARCGHQGREEWVRCWDVLSVFMCWMYQIVGLIMCVVTVEWLIANIAARQSWVWFWVRSKLFGYVVAPSNLFGTFGSKNHLRICPLQIITFTLYFCYITEIGYFFI